MNLATPILIANQNEDFRSLLREMLTKHGFFHVLEASSTDELIEMMTKEKKNCFVIVQGPFINERFAPLLLEQKDYIILAQPDDEKSLPLVARFGVRRFMSFPFSSKDLLTKIQKISSSK